MSILALLLAMPTAQAQLSAGSATGVDDYPSSLKNAGQDTVADPWNFWNRECTSFVAYRLNKAAGVPFHNYYLGPHWGDASNWKYAAQQVRIPVDDTPKRGAVAWWAKGSPGSSSGHVAWVLAVGSSSVTIEEYNYLYRGGYSQRTLYAGSSAWPTGFIHFDTVDVRNTTAPSISGTTQVGSTLTANPGSWTPSRVSYSYQWLADNVAVAGATSRTFVPSPAQVGKRLRVKVTGTQAGSSATATSTRTTIVRRGAIDNTLRPSVSGTPQVGLQLSASRGSWSPSNNDYTFQWLANGEPVDGATRRVFTPRAGQLGAQVSVQVTARADGRVPTTATSYRTADVEPGVLQVAEPPTITGTPQVDNTLAATAGSWSPRARYHYQWKSGGEPVPGANARTFAPSARQLGQKISVVVTASRTGYHSSRAPSPATTGVARATFASVGQASITGTAQVDRPLTAGTGAWTPQGTPSYQWFVAGDPVPGATGATFVPRARDRHQQVTLTVTMRRDGYRTATTAAPATEPVLRGTYLHSTPASVQGTPQVDAPLTVDPGTWSPTPRLSYQWFADGEPVDGARSATFVPTPAQVDQALTVAVTARRRGYVRTVDTTPATATVANGHFRARRAPVVTGFAALGHTLSASPGRWSVHPSGVAFQWYADGVAIEGANAQTYTPTEDVLDRTVTVVATASAHGYEAAQSTSEETAAVVRGRIAFATRPSLLGSAVVGRTLRVAPGTWEPSEAVVTYTWRRSGKRLRDAQGPRYVVGPDDVGKRLSVSVSLAAPQWAPTAARLGTGRRSLTVPDPTVATALNGRRVRVGWRVRAPGLGRPDGRVVVVEGERNLGRTRVSDGRGHLTLRRLAPGRHRLHYTYTGRWQTSVTRRFVVHVPRR